MAPKIKVVASVDADVLEIANFYREAGKSVTQSVIDWWKCGEALRVKKAQIEMSGQWLEWLKSNADTLGFEKRAAQLMMQFARENAQPTAYISQEVAIELIRKLWGKGSQLNQQSLSNEHYTPEEYIEAAREVMGGIDLDPASCEVANAVVKAERFFTEEDNGLEQGWEGRVWLNPPYGSRVGSFITKLSKELKRGVSSATVLVNAHCTDTDWFRPLWDGCLCFTNHRINFYGDDERSGSTHGSVFVYFGNDDKKFADRFIEFGAVVKRFP